MNPQTHALLLTDVVDSTKLAETLGDARMAEVWAAHDRLARDLLPVHQGREIDKTDGFLLLFDAAADAVAYALAYHRALSPLGLSARAGLHVGPVLLRENPPADVAFGAKPLEVEGLAKPTAARVMSLALPGQTLLTADAADALTLHRVTSGPDGTLTPSSDPVLLAHGHWMLKGLLAPVPLYEVGVPGVAPMTPPPDAPKAWRVLWKNDAWIPVRAVKHSLPAERDAFVGREADLQALARRLDEGVRLISVLGMGGTGKTRLVTHYGWTWLGSWPGGVWFCDLSEARGVDGIVAAVSRALDVPLGKDDPVIQLGHALASRGKCMMVLDNFEQVARCAHETLGQWLDRAADAQFVVTSREVLGLPGERSLALAPLVEHEALDLFVARAVAAKRDFDLSDADRPHVRALVKLLDGLPLAIELAAARVRVMPPKHLLERMSERFKLLASSGGRHTRQATLRATLDWSWDLLSTDEQRALMQLSVFEGGFTLEAAEAVLALEEAWATDAVQGLVDKSLVRRVSEDRFDLLVSVQEYAAEQLSAAGRAGGGGPRRETEARHGGWFAALAEHQNIEHLSIDLDNLVVACRRAVASARAGIAVAALEGAWIALESRGPLALGVQLATAVLTMPGLEPEQLGRSLRMGSAAIRRVGNLGESRRYAEAGLSAAREAGARGLEGRLLVDLGSLNAQLGAADIERGVAQAEAGLALCQQAGNRRAVGVALGNLGVLHASRGDHPAALEAFHAALEVHRGLGNRASEGQVLGNLGKLFTDLGRFAEAQACIDAAIVLHRQTGNRRLEAVALGNLGGLYASQRRFDAARPHLEDALAAHRELGSRRDEGLILGNLGAIHLESDRVEEAERYLRPALAVAREVADPRGLAEHCGVLGFLYTRQGRLLEARALLEESVALNRELGYRETLVVALERLGALARALGDLELERQVAGELERQEGVGRP